MKSVKLIVMSDYVDGTAVSIVNAAGVFSAHGIEADVIWLIGGREGLTTIVRELIRAVRGDA